VGTLTHGVALHGKKYETSIDVWGDGLRMALEDPYFPECKLRIRQGQHNLPLVTGFSWLHTILFLVYSLSSYFYALSFL